LAVGFGKDLVGGPGPDEGVDLAVPLLIVIALAHTSLLREVLPDHRLPRTSSITTTVKATTTPNCTALVTVSLSDR
jgi:hypothetical protein